MNSSLSIRASLVSTRDIQRAGRQARLSADATEMKPTKRQEPKTEGSPERARSLAPRWLRGLFVDLLARPPYERERELWTDKPVPELVESLLSQSEFWEEWVQTQLYYFLLVDNFRPESEALLQLPERLRAGQSGVTEALLRIALCASFDRRNPGADTFVTVVMEQLLGIEVQKNTRQLEIGKHVYEGGRGKFLGVMGSSQADVVKIAIEDDRCLERFIEREYERLILATLNERDVKGYADALRAGDRPYREILKEWLLSDAYAQRFELRAELPNRVFARSLFVDLFDRLPDTEEVRRIRSALDGLGDAGPLRSALVRILLDSGKVSLPTRDEIESPTKWIRASFVRYFGRQPTEEELDTFRESFRDPVCRPETVVYALLTHPEYASR